jgi:NADH oxidase (H2O2-forming)
MNASGAACRKELEMQFDVVVIGGGPAGVITALTTKRVYPELSVAIIKEVGDGVIPCAIPYMIRTLSDPEQNRMGDQPLKAAGIEMIIAKAISIDPESESVRLDSGKTVAYRRLVLATGSHPITPSIPGVALDGVLPIQKSLSAMTDLRRRAHESKRVVIMGGGFIGAEFADELTGLSGTAVHLVEIQPKIMSTAFDDELCEEIEKRLSESGVTLHTGRRITAIEGEKSVEAVRLDNDETISTDMVIVGVGAKPASRLAAEAGLLTTDTGAIWVDSYMRTKRHGIFAVGDCALKRDFFTRKEIPIMLASNATAEARIAGTNLLGIRVMRQVQGTISAFSTKVGGVSFASAGMTCRTCKEEGFRSVSATATAPDRHPGFLPGATPMTVKLVFADRSGMLLGGQVMGGDSVGELINMVALGIEKKITVRELEMMQIATHPLLTSAPTVHPLIQAASLALSKMRERQRGAGE